MQCPICSRSLTQFGKFWMCPEDGPVDAKTLAVSPTISAQPQRVFISYGRLDAREFAERLAADLKQHGHDVWIDLESIDKGALFEVHIEHGIRDSTVVAAVMTRHSLREESICRDEVVFALNEGKKVVPLRADSDPLVKPTLLLARRNWIDFTEDYNFGLDALLRYLSGDESILRPPRLPTVTGVAPLDFGVEIAKYSAGFTGRHWLGYELDRWLVEDGKRALVIVAEPGVGKSAIAAWLSLTRPEVVGIHFCTQQNTRSRDPYELVACLVGQLHARLPGYAEAVEASHPEIRRPTAADAFRELIVEPARALPDPPHPRLVIIDSLDEAATREGETVLDVLVKQAPDLPSWLRIITTTRPEEQILKRVRSLNVVELFADRPENLSDIRQFIQMRIGTVGAAELGGHETEKALATRIESLAQGNFLYARLVMDALEDGSLTTAGLGHLTPGLTVFYSDAFSRRFPDVDAYVRTYAPLIRALAVARGPLPLRLLGKIRGESLETVRRRLLGLRAYLRVFGRGEAEAYSLFHKSMQDWLTDPNAAGDYWCHTRSGHAQIADVLLEDRRSDEYALRHLPTHLIEAERWDDLAALLADLHFIEAKCAAGMTHDLVTDYHAAIDALPEAQQQKQQHNERNERITRLTRGLIAHARAWNDARFGQAGNQCDKPLSGPESPHWVEMIPSVRPWTNEEIADDSQRIILNPSRLDRVRAFARFVTSEAHQLPRYADKPMFCIQQAHNHADGGPVAQVAKQLLGSRRDGIALLKARSSLPKFNPHPAVLFTLDEHSDEVTAADLTANGRIALSGSRDRTLRVWAVDTGRCVKILEGHSGAVFCVSMTPDGRFAVSAGEDRALRFWDMESGRCLNILGGHSLAVRTVSITPDGRLAVSGSAGGTLRVWILESKKCIAAFEGHLGAVTSMCLTPDGRFALSAGEDQTLRFWGLETGRCLRILGRHPDRILAVALAPDGCRAVSGGVDGVLRVWDTVSGRLLRTLKGHTAAVRAVSLTFDGNYAVSAGTDRSLRVWNLESGQCLRVLQGHTRSVSAVRITPDGRLAISGSDDQTLRVWDMEAGRFVPDEERQFPMSSTVTLTPDGRFAVSGCWDGTLRVREVEDGRKEAVMEGHSDTITTASVTRDGRVALSGSRDHTLRLWELPGGGCVRILRGHSDEVNAVCVTPDGRFAVSGSTDKKLRVWDLKTGACLHILEGHPGAVSAVHVSSDGRLAVSGSWDRTLRVWDLDTGRCLSILEGHLDWISGASTTPDGRRIVSSSWDKTLRVWDLRTHLCLTTLAGHAGPVSGVSVLYDGMRAVSASSDNTLRVWQLCGNQCLTVVPHSAPLLAFAVHGSLAISLDRQETVHCFNIHDENALSPVITPVRLWRFGTAGAAGAWDDRITAFCECCRKHFEPTPAILDTIRHLSVHLKPEQAPCISLAPDAWHDPVLKSECPRCLHPLHFNPFIVDNRDRF